jgi:hypothetical protein
MSDDTRFPRLDITCPHDSPEEYFCGDCSYQAAGQLQRTLAALRRQRDEALATLSRQGEGDVVERVLAVKCGCGAGVGVHCDAEDNDWLHIARLRASTPAPDDALATALRERDEAREALEVAKAWVKIARTALIHLETHGASEGDPAAIAEKALDDMNEPVEPAAPAPLLEGRPNDDEPCDKCGRTLLTVPVTHANGHALPPGCRVAIGQKQLDEILSQAPLLEGPRLDPATVEACAKVVEDDCPTKVDEASIRTCQSCKLAARRIRALSRAPRRPGGEPTMTLERGPDAGTHAWPREPIPDRIAVTKPEFVRLLESHLTTSEACGVFNRAFEQQRAATSSERAAQENPLHPQAIQGKE